MWGKHNDTRKEHLNSLPMNAHIPNDRRSKHEDDSITSHSHTWTRFGDRPPPPPPPPPQERFEAYLKLVVTRS